MLMVSPTLVSEDFIIFCEKYFNHEGFIWSLKWLYDVKNIGIEISCFFNLASHVSLW